jgi:uncharacterized membrane protein
LPMIHDFIPIFIWWFLIFSLGIVFLPLTLSLFSKFFDKGYTLSKIMGILLVSYLVWLFGSLKILPFITTSIWLIIILSLVVNLFITKIQKVHLKKLFKSSWRIFVFEEILFFLCLAFWSYVRGFQPAIQGLEKFMDFGFVNSILRSQYFPPADMWLAGETINYYYFGHLVTAVLSKLSGIDSTISYNLMIATLFAFTLTAAFSLGGNLITHSMPKTLQKRNVRALTICNFFRLNKKAIIAGLLSAFLLTLGGNFHPLYWFLTHGNFSGYWYPDATRFIVQQFGAADNTIHEFPIYSFVVADLHGHLLDLPFALLFLGLMVRIIRLKKLGFIDFVIPSLTLAVMYTTNAWDFPIYFLVLGAVILWLNHQKYGLAIKTFSKTFLFSIFYFLFSISFSLPFHINFKPIASGVALTDFHSPLWMLAVLWGFPLLITLSFTLFLITKKRITNYELRITDTFILILFGVSWFLIIFPEIFYIKDIYIHSHQRANTMFKLTYQSFVMFSLVGGYILVRLITGIRQNLFKFLIVLFNFSFLFFIFLYPYFAIRSYYGLKNYQGLYGLNYLKSLYPDDYQAILWLKQNISGQPVIVEAVGESYTDFARVSANTGLPTILGWRVHEWLWRGSFDEPAKRTEEVKEIYESENLEETKKLLTKYNVGYIFVGTLEQQAYPNLKEEKFTKIGKLIFTNNKTQIYQVK